MIVNDHITKTARKQELKQEADAENERLYSTYFKMHPPIQKKARTVSLPVHLEVY